jgi:endonuclease G, mitochondrial
MKRFLFLLIVAFFFSFQQEKTKFFDKGIYKVWYSEEYRNPVKVQYSVYHYRNNDSVNRKSMNFYSEKGVKTASTKDFTKNVYDKGHLCPAETFSYTKEVMKLTFSYLNCALQYYELNRGLWSKLEHLERKWSADDSLIVTVEVLFDEPVKKLPTGTSIPKAFKKNIHFYKANKTECYVFPNEECRNGLEIYKK